MPDNWAYVPTTDADGATLGGYSYYTEILKPGDKTTPLIDEVKTNFDPYSTKNTDNITDFDIIVYSESVQTVEPGLGREYLGSEWSEAWKSFLQ